MNITWINETNGFTPNKPEQTKVFYPSGSFQGYKENYVFTTREHGTGYYMD